MGVLTHMMIIRKGRSEQEVRRNLRIDGSKSHMLEGLESEITRCCIIDMKRILLEVLLDERENQEISRQGC